MAESFDKQLEIADVYAQALFEIARQAGHVGKIREELEELMKLVDDQPDLAAFFSSRAFDAEQRRQTLESWFRGKLDDDLLNTLLVLNRNGRTGLLRALQRAFTLREEADLGQVEAVAITAVELDEKQKGELLQLASELTGKKPLIDFRVDPEVLGGLLLRIGDMLYDNSVRSQLRGLQRQLSERGERGAALRAAVG